MDIRHIASRIDRIARIVEGWNRSGEIPAVERGIVERSLAELYEAVRFDTPAAAQHVEHAEIDIENIFGTAAAATEPEQLPEPEAETPAEAPEIPETPAEAPAAEPVVAPVVAPEPEEEPAPAEEIPTEPEPAEEPAAETVLSEPENEPVHEPEQTGKPCPAPAETATEPKPEAKLEEPADVQDAESAAKPDTVHTEAVAENEPESAPAETVAESEQKSETSPAEVAATATAIPSPADVTAEPESETAVPAPAEAVAEPEPENEPEPAAEPAPEPEPVKQTSLFDMDMVRRPRSSGSRRIIMSLYGDTAPRRASEQSAERRSVEHKSVEQETAAAQAAAEPEAVPTVTPEVQPAAETAEHTAVLGEVINAGTTTVADAIAASQPEDVASHIVHSDRINDLNRAIGINDKFIMIRDLFGGDSEAYAKAIADLNAFTDFDECLVYIASNYRWNPDSDGTRMLMELLTRKLL